MQNMKELTLMNLLILAGKIRRQILADDEIGTVVYVGDLEIYRLSGLAHPTTGELQNSDGQWQKVIEISESDSQQE